MSSEMQYTNQKEVLIIKAAEQLMDGGNLIRNREVCIGISALKEVTFQNCDVIAEKCTLDHCHFENCDLIECKELNHCSLDNCDGVLVYDGRATGCQFTRLGSMHLQNTIVDNCVFDCIGHHDDIICMEDSQIINSKFSNVGMCNEAYLIDAVGECSVENCNFSNCSTDRADLELIHCEETVGRIFKRKKEFDITDNCTGLDNVKRGPGPIEIGSFRLR